PPPSSTLLPYPTLFRSRTYLPASAGVLWLFGGVLDPLMVPWPSTHSGCSFSAVSVVDSLNASLSPSQLSTTKTALKEQPEWVEGDRKSTRLNSSHRTIS